MKKLMYLVLGTMILLSCKKDLDPIYININSVSGCTDSSAINYNANATTDDSSCIFFSATPFIIETPFGFPEMNIPSNNPMTTEGIALGNKLFHDKILSGNGMQACADCHVKSAAFSDTNQFSAGIDGIFGRSMWESSRISGWSGGWSFSAK